MSAPSPRYPSGRALVQALAARKGAPVGVHLQVADRCNHACRHCYQVQGLKGELGLDDLRRLLDDLAEAGVLTLNVSGGEATLRHDLLDILAHARARGFAVRLYTNAFLVDEALAARLAEVGLYEVHVSVYSAAAAEHDAVTRVPGSFERTVAGVRALRARGLRVVLKSPQTALSTEGAAGVARLARELDCAFRAGATLTAMEDGSLAPLEVSASPAQLLASGLLTPWAPAADPDRERAGRLGVSPCGVGRSGVVVLPDGAVQPCTDTPVRVGDARAEGFAAVLRSETLTMLRGVSWADVHGCRDCALVPACQRCHATALHQGGDYFGPYALACAQARARYEAAAGGLEVLPPREDCEPGRDPAVGPYAIESHGKIRPTPDVRTPDDDARALRHPWIRKAPAPPEGAALVPASRLLRAGRGGGETPRLPTDDGGATRDGL
ncbi:MAG: radical SAM protein [Polyangiales bacterium]